LIANANSEFALRSHHIVVEHTAMVTVIRGGLENNEVLVCKLGLSMYKVLTGPPHSNAGNNLMYKAIGILRILKSRKTFWHALLWTYLELESLDAREVIDNIIHAS
jgi:hypothetical protein